MRFESQRLAHLVLVVLVVLLCTFVLYCSFVLILLLALLCSHSNLVLVDVSCSSRIVSCDCLAVALSCVLCCVYRLVLSSIFLCILYRFTMACLNMFYPFHGIVEVIMLTVMVSGGFRRYPFLSLLLSYHSLRLPVPRG